MFPVGPYEAVLDVAEWPWPALRVFSLRVAGGLFFKLLLRRSFWIGFLVGFLVECVLVGAAVMN